MKICITGSFGNHDIGDDAMLEEHLRHLDAWGHGRNDITLYGHQPDYMAGYFNHPAERCKCSRKTPNPKEHDCLIVTGGGTINNRKHSKSTHRLYRLVMPFVHAGKPVFMSGQTIGPFGGQHAQAKQLIESVDVLTVRDVGWSKYFMRVLRAKPKELIETVDDATSLPLADESDVPEDVMQFAYGAVAVNVTRYTIDTAEKRKLIHNLVGQVTNRNQKVLLVPHDPEDHEFLREVEKINSGLIRYWDTSGAKAGQIKAVLNQCRFGIGGRYHFGVFCMSVGTPVVMLTGSEYSHVKNMGLAGHYDQQFRVVDVEDWYISSYLLFQLQQMPSFMRPRDPTRSSSFPRLKQWLEKM